MKGVRERQQEHARDSKLEGERVGGRQSWRKTELEEDERGGLREREIIQ